MTPADRTPRICRCGARCSGSAPFMGNSAAEFSQHVAVVHASHKPDDWRVRSLVAPAWSRVRVGERMGVGAS